MAMSSTEKARIRSEQLLDQYQPVARDVTRELGPDGVMDFVQNCVMPLETIDTPEAKLLMCYTIYGIVVATRDFFAEEQNHEQEEEDSHE